MCNRPVLAVVSVALALAAALSRPARAEEEPGAFREMPGGGFASESGGVRVEADRTGGVDFERVPAPEWAPGGARFRYRLEGVAVGLRRTDVTGLAAEVALEGPRRLAIRRPGVVDEIYEPRRLGIEQLFTLPALPGAPAAGRDLVLEGRFTTALDLLSLKPDGAGGVSLRSGGRQVLHYGAAVAFDAKGRSIAARTEVAGDLVRIVVDGAWAAEAEMPITVDPLVSGSRVAVSVASTIERRCDTAYSVTQDAYIVVYDEDRGSGSRIMAGRYTFDGQALDPVPNSTTNAFEVTATAAADTAKVAWIGGVENKYLVAWVDRFASPEEVRGAIIDAADPNSPPAMTLLPNPITVAALATDSIASLAVSGREDGGPWLVSFMVTTSSGIGFGKGRLVNADGSLGTNLFITGSSGNLREGIAANRLAAAGEPWLVVWSQLIAGAHYNVAAVTVSAGGVRDSNRINTNIAGSASLDEREPSVDGLRAPWAVAWAQGPTNSAITDVSVRLVGANSNVASSTVTVTASADDEGGPVVAATDSDVLVAWTHAVAAPSVPTHIVRFSRYDPTLAVVRESSVQATFFTSATATANAAVARQNGAATTQTANYLLAYEVHFDPTDADPEFLRIEGIIPAALEVRETTTSGRLVVNGQAADGASARFLPDTDISAGASAPLTIVVSNTGGTTLTGLGTPALVAGTHFAVNAAGFPSSLAPGASGTFAVTFDPGTTGLLSDTVEFTHGATTGPGAQTTPFTFDVRGIGLDGPTSGFAQTVSPFAAIPDNDPAGVSSTITVPAGLGEVLGVTVTVNITHPFDNDLTILLTSPGGVTVTLSQNLGFGGDNYTNTIFADDAPDPISAGSPPFTGRFRPQDALSIFRGGDSAGVWTLTVVDDGIGDLGTLDSWTLQLSTRLGPQLEVREGSATGTVIASGAAAGGGRAFGSRGVSAGPSAPVTIVVRNTGTGPLVLGTPALSGAGAGHFVLSTSGFSSTVAAGAETSITVAFDPSAVGSFTAQVSFAHSAPGVAGSPFTFEVSGTGSETTVARARRSGGGGGGCAAGGAADPGLAALVLASAAAALLRRRVRPPRE